jgi:hypothetical protein
VPVKSCIEDAAAALAWAFAHAARYGGSPDKIHVSGASAGGYLAAMVGLDKQYLAVHGLDPDRLAGLVPLTGQMITHFRVRQERGLPDTQPVVDEMAPLYHVRKDAPPVLLITGDRELEMLGRYEENAYFARMMKVVGHPRTELIEIQGHDHSEVIPAANRLLLRRVAGGFSKATMLRNMQEVSARNVRIMSTVLTLFAAVIAVGVVYNHARIALAERTWELASLRVLGFTRGEVSGMLFAELAIELALALPLGLWLGHEFVAWLVEVSATELFSIPPVIALRSYAIAALIVVAAAMVSAWIVRRRIDRLDLVGVLKTRE